MKIVRFNDRIWFGKHKGTRVCDLLHHDPSFVKKLIDDKLIQLDDKTNNHFEEITGVGSNKVRRQRQAGNLIDRIINQEINQDARFRDQEVRFKEMGFYLHSRQYQQRRQIIEHVLRTILLPRVLTVEVFNMVFDGIMNKVDRVLIEGYNYDIKFRVNENLRRLRDVQCVITLNDEIILHCDATP